MSRRGGRQGRTAELGRPTCPQIKASLGSMDHKTATHRYSMPFAASSACMRAHGATEYLAEASSHLGRSQQTAGNDPHAAAASRARPVHIQPGSILRAARLHAAKQDGTTLSFQNN